MTKSLVDLYNNLSINGVRTTNNFQIGISGTGISAIDKAFENITFHAQSAQLPAVNIESADVKYMAFAFHQATTMSMSRELQTDVWCDVNMNIRDALEAWSNHVIDHDIEGGSVMGGFKRPSRAVIRLDLLDDINPQVITKTYLLRGAFPASVGSATLSNNSADIMTFPLNIKYQYFTKE
jgi:hypothetical protein